MVEQTGTDEVEGQEIAEEKSDVDGLFTELNQEDFILLMEAIAHGYQKTAGFFRGGKVEPSQDVAGEIRHDLLKHSKSVLEDRAEKLDPSLLDYKVDVEIKVHEDAQVTVRPVYAGVTVAIDLMVSATAKSFPAFTFGMQVGGNYAD